MSLRLFPQQASVGAEQVDQLFFFLVGTAFFFTGLIFVLIVYFALRYRRGVRADRSAAPEGSLKLEVIWSVIPLVIMMFSFVWGAKLYVRGQLPPTDAIEIYVVGKQWMWKVQHSEGRSEINELHVPVGEPVHLRMISEDVIHSLFLPEFRIKQDVLPGRYTSMWFQANKIGTYHLFCAEYCGTSHSLMRGQVIVQNPADYARWLADRVVEAPEVAGRRLFERYRCESCHREASSEEGPAITNFFGTTVRLGSGRKRFGI
jgi:cytochrome c oxidase subunit 2